MLLSGAVDLNMNRLVKPTTSNAITYKILMFLGM
jgi:hypothetical protein